MFKKKSLGIILLVVLLVFTGCSSNNNDNGNATDVNNGNDNVSVGEDVLPQLDFAAGLDDNGFYEGIKALDFVTLGEYENIGVPEEVHVIPQEAVAFEVEGLLASFSTQEQVMDRAILDGDTVNIDYVGSIDGVEFDGGSTGGAGTDVTIGVTPYIDDFLEQLIGHTPGETFDIEVTFPEDYGVENLNGKDAIFGITVNYISETIAPELTDAFVEENFMDGYGWSTVAEMEVGIQDNLQDTAVKNYVYNEVLGAATVAEVPETVMDFHKTGLENEYTSTAMNYGMTLDEFLLAYAGLESIDQLFEAAAEEIKNLAESTMIIQALAEDANLMVSDEDLTAFFMEINGTGDYSQYEAAYGKAYLKYTILQDVVINHLVDMAVLK